MSQQRNQKEKKWSLKDINDAWSEIFEEIEYNAIPIEYIHAVDVVFKNKKTWSIAVEENLSNKTWDEFEKEVREILDSYKEEIEHVNFKLDTEKLRVDITNSTKKFFKNRKLK